MDIYRFFNSKDVASYLRGIGYEFNAFEAAYIVDHCDSATIDEKIDAWQQIVDTMPDCPTGWNHDVGGRESIHDFLHEYIALQRRLLDMFEQSEECVYFVKKARYEKLPEWLVRTDRVGNWIEWSPVPFSSLVKCIEPLKAERENGVRDCYVVSKMKVDSPEPVYGYSPNELVLDGDFRPLEVGVSGLNEQDSGIAYQFCNSFVEMPVPFMRGDIVIDRTDPEPHPFVFDHLKFWNSAEFAEHGGKPLPPEKAEKLDQRVARRVAKHTWDISHMVACGYELGSHYGGGPLDDPCDICFDVFGASNNYLDLELYDGPLEGELKALKLVSQFVKDEIDEGLAMNFVRLVDLEARASRIRRSYDSEYTESVHGLY